MRACFRRPLYRSTDIHTPYNWQVWIKALIETPPHVFPVGACGGLADGCEQPHLILHAWSARYEAEACAQEADCFFGKLYQKSIQHGHTIDDSVGSHSGNAHSWAATLD